MRMTQASILQRRLDALGLTQRSVAEALDLSESAVSRKIAGRSPWRISELHALAALMGSTTADVLTLIGEDAA